MRIEQALLLLATRSEGESRVPSLAAQTPYPLYTTTSAAPS